MGPANRLGKGRQSGGGKEVWDGREKRSSGDSDWARKMSMDELRGVRGKISEHIKGLRAKGVTDPAEYEGAMRKMEMVEVPWLKSKYS